MGRHLLQEPFKVIAWKEIKRLKSFIKFIYNEQVLRLHLSLWTLANVHISCPNE